MKTLSKIKNCLANGILAAFVLIFLWILANGLLAYDAVSYFYNPILLAFGILLFIPAVLAFRKYLIPRLARIAYLPALLLALFTVLCFICGTALRVGPSWDMGEVFKVARYAANGDAIESYYLYYFPNNLMMALIYTVVFKAALLVGFTDLVTVATCFNTLLVVLTGILLYLSARRLYGKELSLLLLFLTLFTTPFYLYTALYYTDTASMFFITAMLYLAVRVRQAKSSRSGIIAALLFGITAFFAYETKVTTFILLIALVIYLIYRGFDKKAALQILVAGAVFVILLAMFGLVKGKVFDPKLSDELEYPLEHWVMMGLNGVGTFSAEDYAYTNSFPSYAEKQAAVRKNIAERFALYDANSFIKHLTSKLKFAWTDGLFFAPEKLRREPVSPNILHEFVLPGGKYNAFYKYLPQIMHFSMLIFMTLSAYAQFKKRGNKSIESALILAVFGLLLFLLIWENRSRYVITMLPIMLLLQLSGMEFLLARHAEKVRARKLQREENPKNA